MDKKLIIDIGMHKGEDIGFYLHMGYKVLGIDANLEMINLAKLKFQKYIEDESLILLNCAVSSEDFGKIEFNLSEESLWSSIKPEVSTRLGKKIKKVVVPTRTLGSIIEEFGIPYYCKIDAAGYEEVCLDTLNQNQLPDYISVESECIGEGATLTQDEALATLRKLAEIGYTRFKLVDQLSLLVLTPETRFYFDNSTPFNAFVRKLNRARVILRRIQYLKKFNYHFGPSASGPFGESLIGKWIDFDLAAKTLLRHRTEYFARGGFSPTRSFSFWCDWHATK